MVKVPPPPTSHHRHTPLPNAKGTIFYTETDEAPALATYALYPVLNKFCAMSEVDICPCDISVAGRVMAAFPEYLEESQRVPDNLGFLGQLTLEPDCVIIKLPNISAPVNQLQDCIAELRSKGFLVPLYPTDPQTPEERQIQERYNKIAGSAVNPVLRQGNSDRRAAKPVKAYAQQNPHKMGPWSQESRTHVAHMTHGDYYGSELSVVMDQPTHVQIVLQGTSGKTTILKDNLALQAGEVIDASYMSIRALTEYYETEMSEAKKNQILLSLHLKATMMKVSDPVFFGHSIRVYFKDAFEKHGDVLERMGVNPDRGLAAMFEVIRSQSETPEQAQKIIDDFQACFQTGPSLAMVDSDKGITNLHAPNDIIIDASMAVVIRDSGKMWNQQGQMEDVKCLIPDRSYATMYKEAVEYVKKHGQFDVATMGSVDNVGLMAQKAEEYGSHDKTFKIPEDGCVQVRDTVSGQIYMQHDTVEKGDVWRMCQTKNAPIRDWVRLAVERARMSGAKAIFWLDTNRAHDRNIIHLVQTYLKDHDMTGVDVSIAHPVDACRQSMERASAGEDTITVTGNVLRDYLTDLFPVLELGTSAKMLSIVPLLAGGGLYETGAGGSAPKHVHQFIKEDHLRWDSLGEYLALAVAFEKLGVNNPKAKWLGECLNKAVGRLLYTHHCPSRAVHKIDNRGAHFYIALYWADFLQQPQQDTEVDVSSIYKPLYEQLSEHREQIIKELSQSQGVPVDLGGYYLPDQAKARVAMNPSSTLNSILNSFGPVADFE